MSGDGEFSSDLSLTRASDAERDGLVARLSDACAAGRLTLGEFEERVGIALEARTHGELERLVADLPASTTPELDTATPGPSKAKWTFTIFSGHKRAGRWTLPKKSVYFTLFGGVELDLTEAELSAAEVAVTVVAVFGGAEISVPDAVRMDVSGFTVFGGKEVEQFHRPPPGAPKIDFRLIPIFGGIAVKSRRRGLAVGPDQDR